MLCIALLLALFCALLLRLPYGFDWTDEAYYSVLPYRFVLGDRPLLDTWEVHQLSGMLSLPFLRLYLLFTVGDMTGVMLFFRYVLACVQLLISLYAFFVLRRRSGNIWAFLCAGLMLMHVHYGLNGFSYNAMTPLFCMLSALLVFDGMDGRHPLLKVWLGGVFYAFAVQAYPYFALSVPVYGIFWWQFLRRHQGQAGAKRLPVAFGAGVISVLALFAAFVAFRSSGGNLLAGLRGMLGDPDHVAESPLLILAQYANSLRVLFGPVSWGAAILCVVGILACFWKNPRQKAILSKVGLGLCALLIFAAVIWVAAYDYPNHHKINLAAASLALFAPGLYFLSGRKVDRSMLLFFLGFALSLAVQLGSNTRIRSSSGMLLPASIGTLLYLADCTRGIFSTQRAQIIFRRAAFIGCACQLLLTSGLRLGTVYRDAPLSQLDTVMAEGPAKGVVTTAENAAAYAGIYQDFMDNAPKQGNLLVTNLLPVAYLMTGMRPATPSTFNMTMDSDWLAQYYAENPERMPDCVYAVDAGVGHGNELSLEGAAGLPELIGEDIMQNRLSGGVMFLAQG